ncbi:Vitamin K epoxide reductase [Acaryochloris thomasi RCC1774]|uniref:Vitamin K epoxide reductase n=1 Tax=Acaryochloris thomasi RCC1774 TaxID=1764569 RepID=A0A2W1JPE1_9CYAN|nr:vitamin K epoxide reductase family protein [Acaryochloris thomasi]PZD75169.1 Vitamin K epoxide reductase [Acaryochloris thomasi RCC1774]
MSRRRSKSSSVLHRWSRPAIGAIATLGAINTAYITATRLLGSETACPTEGCAKVLSSPYATVFGQPLALFGLIAYIVMAVFALGPLAINPTEKKQLRIDLENKTWLLLFLGSTAMMLFSFYLMYIMVTKFVVPLGPEAVCIYCIASAFFATAMFVLTLMGRAWDDIGQLLFSGVIVGLITIIATLAVYAPIGQPVAEAYNIESGTGEVFFSVEKESSEAEIELAKHLKSVGANMYGAYWCPHCYDQKKLFGVAALSEMPYVECSPDGKDSQPQVCQDLFTKIEKETGEKAGFPTWDVNGKYLFGSQSLEELAQASGYQGPQDFKQ